MSKIKHYSVGNVSIRISKVERCNSLSNPRHCFTLSILDDDKKQIYRREMVVHCDFDDANTDEELHIVIGKLLRNIEELVPQTRWERGKFDKFIECLEEELYRYSQMTKPLVTLF